MNKIISKKAIDKRNNWINIINDLEGDFAFNSEFIEKELNKEFEKEGIQGLLDHLRLCGNIPESYRVSSSKEKLYSKYTDIILSIAYERIGINSLVLSERAGVADVEGVGKKFSFVADAKAFRLSRTTVNQKDLKIQSMDEWKYGKKYAMVVSPIYQLPSKNSQIYQQATKLNVCIFTYSHLSLLVRYADETRKIDAEDLLFTIFKKNEALNLTDKALTYWANINENMLGYSNEISLLWKDEKIAAAESIEIAKKEALIYLASERERIMRLNHKEALKELVKASKIDSKIKTIEKMSDNGLFGVK